MKRILLSFVGLMGGYYLFTAEQAPSEVEDVMESVAPRQAAIALQLPTSRSPVSIASASVAAEPAVALDDRDAKAAADDFISLKKEDWGIQPHHEIRYEAAFTTPLGKTIKYKIFQGELAMSGMDVEVRLGNDRTVKDVSVHYNPVAEIDTTQLGMNPDQILTTVSDRFEMEASQSASQPMVYVPHGIDSKPVLAYAMTVRRKGSEGEPIQAVFRASDGQILDLTVARPEIRN